MFAPDTTPTALSDYAHCLTGVHNRIQLWQSYVHVFILQNTVHFIK
jgi:hypothetical protein